MRSNAWRTCRRPGWKESGRGGDEAIHHCFFLQYIAIAVAVAVAVAVAIAIAIAVAIA